MKYKSQTIVNGIKKATMKFSKLCMSPARMSIKIIGAIIEMTKVSLLRPLSKFTFDLLKNLCRVSRIKAVCFWWLLAGLWLLWF